MKIEVLFKYLNDSEIEKLLNLYGGELRSALDLKDFLVSIGKDEKIIEEILINL